MKICVGDKTEVVVQDRMDINIYKSNGVSRITVVVKEDVDDDIVLEVNAFNSIILKPRAGNAVRIYEDKS